jgi:hypothetical protein
MEDIKYLYHATYKALIDSIKEHGLDVTKGKANWDYDLPRECIYLAIDPELAESYAETAELVSDEWVNQVVILQIDVSKIRKHLIFGDLNVNLDNDEDSGCFEYYGVIPWDAITIYNL